MSQTSCSFAGSLMQVLLLPRDTRYLVLCACVRWRPTHTVFSCTIHVLVQHPHDSPSQPRQLSFFLYLYIFPLLSYPLSPCSGNSDPSQVFLLACGFARSQHVYFKNGQGTGDQRLPAPKTAPTGDVIDDQNRKWGQGTQLHGTSAASLGKVSCLRLRICCPDVGACRLCFADLLENSCPPWSARGVDSIYTRYSET